MKRIASVSFGKDSTAMILETIRRGDQPDEVIFFDTGWEWDAIYKTRDIIVPILKEHGIEYTELHPKLDFDYMRDEKPIKSRKTGEIHRYGYGWCGGGCRWGTAYKQAAINKHCKHDIQMVGIAADEQHRVKEGKEYPLVEYGITEADALQICYDNGITYEEDGVRLYDVFDRLSCWCCRNKNIEELSRMSIMMPEKFEELCKLEAKHGQMKAKVTLDEIRRNAVKH